MSTLRESKARSCETCQVHSRLPFAVVIPEWPRLNEPWKVVHIDFAGPVNNKRFLAVVGAFSKWLELNMFLSQLTYAATAGLRLLFTTFGIPQVIVSDNGAAVVCPSSS